MEKENIDQSELAKFESLAYRWWDQNSEFKPLHDINPLRMGYITQRAPLAGQRIVDVGCGGGILAESLAKAGATVKGIDLAEAPLSVAKLHATESELNIDYELIRAEELAQREAGQYDLVTCLEMLEHVPHPEQTILACATLVKPGGHVFFSTLNRNPKSYLFAILGAEYVLRLLPKGTHEYEKFIRPAELSHWLRDADLELKDVTGMSYNPITKHYKLTPDVSVNYLVHCQRLPA